MAQKWGFGEIYAGVGEIHAAKGTTDGLLDEGKSTITRLQSAWEGDAANDWATLQMRWDASSTELNEALRNLGDKVQQAAEDMEHTERAVQGSFQG
jgi:early secretory antigenic target protein ESAT-6